MSAASSMSGRQTSPPCLAPRLSRLHPRRHRRRRWGTTPCRWQQARQAPQMTKRGRRMSPHCRPPTRRRRSCSMGRKSRIEILRPRGVRDRTTFDCARRGRSRCRPRRYRRQRWDMTPHTETKRVTRSRWTRRGPVPTRSFRPGQPSWWTPRTQMPRSSSRRRPIATLVVARQYLSDLNSAEGFSRAASSAGGRTYGHTRPSASVLRPG
jgi:hypothetical protein